MTDHTNEPTIDYYVLAVITRTGEIRDNNRMYSQGERAATPAIARQLPGRLSPPKVGESLAVLYYQAVPGLWSDSCGQTPRRWASPVVVEIDPPQLSERQQEALSAYLRYVANRERIEALDGTNVQRETAQNGVADAYRELVNSTVLLPGEGVSSAVARTFPTLKG